MMPTEPKPTRERGIGVLLAGSLICCSLVTGLFFAWFINPMRGSSPPNPSIRCEFNREQIESAKLMLAAEQRLTPGTSVNANQLSDYLKDNRMPDCPKGGELTITPIGVPVRCSIHGPKSSAK